MNIPENILSTLTDELKKKVEAAKTPEELLAIAKESGREMSPEQLEAVRTSFAIWGGFHGEFGNQEKKERGIRLIKIK